MNLVASENEVIAVLTLSQPGYDSETLQLINGQRLVVGSDAGADICLVDDVVAAAHCVISAEGGYVTVKDCFTQAGTFVDEMKIRETKLSRNSGICVGAALISVQLSGSGTPGFVFKKSGSHSPVGTAASASLRRTIFDELPQRNEPTPETVATESQLQTIDALQSQLNEAFVEIEVLQNRLTTAGASAVAATVAAAVSPVVDPFQEEMIELLRAEVIELQAALSERDQLTPDTVASGKVAGQSIEADDDHFLGQREADRLVSRLEDLLLELQKRDDQVATLTELLAATEETNRAEQEQTRHLNSWFNDIEARFGDRERDWQTQLTKLQQRLEVVTAERDLAALAVTTDTSNGKLEAAQTLMKGLRETVESQRQQLLAAKQTIDRLRNETTVRQPPVAREELVRLAEERTEIARQRQELEALRSKEQRPGADESALKLMALRQHLNEIHQQEQAEREERKFSNRIAKLWSRLDGRS